MSSNGATVGLKRKEPDDLVLDLLNVSLSSNKKLRTTDTGFTEFTATVQPVLGPVSMPGTPTARPDERAIVLYRPVNPPLFPGGPQAGSEDLPIKVNMPPMFSFSKGIGHGCAPSYFRETSSQLDCQSDWSNYKDSVSGHGLFEALDLSGVAGPVPFSGQRRMSRVSSCCSLPRRPFFYDDQVMVEEIEETNKPHDLALVPWAPMTPVVISSESKPIVEEVDDEPAGDMIDIEDMEVIPENELTRQNFHMDNVVGTTGPSLASSPWQPPPFSELMWS